MTITDESLLAAPSPWVARFVGEIPAGGGVLDVACGNGRHTRLLLDNGHPVTALDREIRLPRTLLEDPRVTLLQADLEAAPWPLTSTRFAGVVVTNYLSRPLLASIVAAVAPGGVLIYATFAVGQERFGRPSNPDFLLRPGELLDAVHGQLEVRAYEHGLVQAPRPALRSCICARRRE